MHGFCNCLRLEQRYWHSKPFTARLLRCLQVYDKRFWTADLEAKARNEIAILQQALHPNVLELLDTFETASSLGLVTEHCTHGDLVKELVLKSSDYSCTLICTRLKQIIQAVLAIHRLVRVTCVQQGCWVLSNSLQAAWNLGTARSLTDIVSGSTELDWIHLSESKRQTPASTHMLPLILISRAFQRVADIGTPCRATYTAPSARAAFC